MRFLPNNTTKMEGRTATLNNAYLGYTEVRIIQYWPTMYKWEVEIIESGKRIFVYDDEFKIHY